MATSEVLKAGLLFTSVLAILLFQFETAFATGNTFQSLSSCICPGYNVSFECTTVGGGSTVWQGTAFNCSLSSNEIILSHARFHGIVGECNNGDICAYAVEVVPPNCFTSRINISVTSSLDGRTVSCDYDDGLMVHNVNTSVLTITRDPLPGPLNVVLADVSADLTFVWVPVVNSCQALSYEIDATNCGLCPRNTNITSASCTDLELSTERRVCTFAVRTVVCDNIVGTLSTETSVIIQVPDAPLVKTTSSYSNNDNMLTKIISTLIEQSSSFNITDNVDGSTILYNITYSDLTSGRICYSVNIPASSCDGGVCIHEFDSTESSCLPSSNISVTAFATNALGDGPPSSPIIRGGINTFVRVEALVDSIICTFSIQYEGDEKSCSIVYGPDCQQPLSEKLSGQVSDGVSVQVPLLQTTERYCYIVTAISGTTIVNITGAFTKLNEPGHIGPGVTVAVVVVIVITIVIVGTVSAIIVVIVTRMMTSKYRMIPIHPKELKLDIPQQSTFNQPEDEGDSEISLQDLTLVELHHRNTIHDEDQHIPAVHGDFKEVGPTYMYLQKLNPLSGD